MNTRHSSDVDARKAGLTHAAWVGADARGTADCTIRLFGFWVPVNAAVVISYGEEHVHTLIYSQHQYMIAAFVTLQTEYNTVYLLGKQARD